MLAKIHLKTACGCKKSFLEKNFKVPMPVHWQVPIVGRNPWSDPNGLRGKSDTYSVRGFALVNWEWYSKTRIELWYEETLWSKNT